MAAETPDRSQVASMVMLCSYARNLSRASAGDTSFASAGATLLLQAASSSAHITNNSLFIDHFGKLII
jgi:hypothetical protein